MANALKLSELFNKVKGGYQGITKEDCLVSSKSRCGSISSFQIPFFCK
jgi:hypothetical protein